MNNSEQPINPIVNANGYPSFERAIENEPTSLIGLTKREYFAAKAMQGLMTKDYVKLHIDIAGGGESGYTNIPMIADMSVQIADALLAELAKKH